MTAFSLSADKKTKQNKTKQKNPKQQHSDVSSSCFGFSLELIYIFSFDYTSFPVVDACHSRVLYNSCKIKRFIIHITLHFDFFHDLPAAMNRVHCIIQSVQEVQNQSKHVGESTPSLLPAVLRKQCLHQNQHQGSSMSPPPSLPNQQGSSMSSLWILWMNTGPVLWRSLSENSGLICMCPDNLCEHYEWTQDQYCGDPCLRTVVWSVCVQTIFVNTMNEHRTSTVAVPVWEQWSDLYVSRQSLWTLWMNTGPVLWQSLSENSGLICMCLDNLCEYYEWTQDQYCGNPCLRTMVWSVCVQTIFVNTMNEHRTSTVAIPVWEQWSDLYVSRQSLWILWMNTGPVLWQSLSENSGLICTGPLFSKGLYLEKTNMKIISETFWKLRFCCENTHYANVVTTS